MSSPILLLLFGAILFLFSIQIALSNPPVGVFLCVCGFFMFSFACFKLDDVNNTPEKQYEEYLQNVEDANKTLQKFYIDHPEFKENN